MEYSLNHLTKLSGVSPRTLRYYDEIGLLKPLRVASSGYRVYGQAQIDILQQILFFRELDFSLEEIKSLLRAPDFDRRQTFSAHLSELLKKRERLDLLIENVTKSMAAIKGDYEMTDTEKFEGFKQSLIDENERRYGKEIREKYGEKAVNESNAKLAGLTQEQYGESERLRVKFEEMLKTAVESGNLPGGGPAGEQAQAACALHKQWLTLFYPKYSKEYHKGLGEMYAADERFRANYEKIAPGATEFLRDAINIYCE